MLLPCWGIRPQLTTTRASRRTLRCCCTIFLNGRVIKLNTLCFITCKSGLDGAFKFAFTGPLVIITTDRLGAVTASAEFNPSPSMPCHYDLLITIISSLDDDPCTFHFVRMESSQRSSLSYHPIITTTIHCRRRILLLTSKWLCTYYDLYSQHKCTNWSYMLCPAFNVDGLLLLITIGDDDGMGSNYYLYVQSFSAGNSSRVCTVFIAFRGSQRRFFAFHYIIIIDRDRD